MMYLFNYVKINLSNTLIYYRYGIKKFIRVILKVFYPFMPFYLVAVIRLLVTSLRKQAIIYLNFFFINITNNFTSFKALLNNDIIFS